MDSDFDFKPINEGLGFHRKVKPLEAEAESDESFSFSALGPGTLSQPKVESNSREQAKGLLTSGSTASSTTTAKSKHNAKSVSDLIAALPPSLDFLVEEPTPPRIESVKNEAVTPASLRKSPLFTQSNASAGISAGIATPGAPAAASIASQEAAEKSGEKSNEKSPDSKRGFLKMPLGRNDYGMKPKTSLAASAAILAASEAAGAITGRAPASIDQNVAKTFPTVFPHLGSLAGQPAAATVKAATKTTSKKTAKGLANGLGAGLGTSVEVIEERHLATHFGSAILDTLVSVGLGCVLLALALSVTNVNLLALLENTQTDAETLTALALLFVAGGLLYVLAARSFMGATLGEWSYEIRVGERAARTRWFYPVLVMWRGLLVAATGFILFPIASLIAGKDVLKYLTGLELVAFDGATASSAQD